ncbi:ABC transporter substrate-binding protein [Sinobaca sp. H24]|uniref:ABC transporter substrate-binding protein n=1 Tax=Sinobaca sp. H24 TaxID=2923376 RepID=UPI00207A7FDC|nr:ABC transporter substrate-binding protein [Sinobaca sp. H24]
MKKALLLTMTAGMAAALAACGGETEEEQGQESSEQESSEQESSEQAEGYPVTITDGMGEEITIEEEPENIVSLLPSNTEIAFALGLGDQIVGVTDFDTYPEEAQEKQSVGGLDFDVETVLSLEPDLILTDSSAVQNSEEGLNQLEEAGAEILVVNDATSFEETYNTINMIGQATGTEEEASSIVETMEEDVASIEETASAISEEDRKTVWVEVDAPPNIFTTGQNTFMDEMLDIIQADNAAAEEEGWVPYTEEDVVALNPDVIVTTYGFRVENSTENILNRDGWSDVPAVESEEVHDLDSDLVSRPGPRLTDGLQQMAEVVYPDVFTEEQ